MKERRSDMYVFDTSPLSVMLKHYYQSRFSSLWVKFGQMINRGEVISVPEIFHELGKGPLSGNQWVSANKFIFTSITESEAHFVRDIFATRQFTGQLKEKDIEEGNPFADPFVVAKAAVSEGIVVTLETKKPNSASIPNICEHFGVPCINLEGFMNRVCWTF